MEKIILEIYIKCYKGIDGDTSVQNVVSLGFSNTEDLIHNIKTVRELSLDDPWHKVQEWSMPLHQDGIFMPIANLKWKHQMT